ncbi:MAG: ATP-dependent 6-phosphofructokinase, partial [Clostridia bacterium]|nr:ATP-dependent 6-phosphofructokinase [Clostridia bacterium]
MESKIKKIGVLTSGGDAPGMNAAVRAVVRAALSAGIEVFGIRRGYDGLMSGDIFKMDMRSVSDIINRGGTFLYSARCPEFNTPEGEMKAVETCKKFGLEGIVVCGGDGSFRGARALTLRGVNCVGIPGTIDNDLACSDYTLGVDTALQTIVSNVDKIRDTSESHDRCTVVEVMGRRCGYLALHSGVATGAVSILVPEIEFDFQKDVIDRIKYTQSLGKQHFIVIAAEGIKYPGGSISAMAKMIEEATG